jgi:DNA-binding PadR family transcriptional regulator
MRGDRFNFGFDPDSWFGMGGKHGRGFRRHWFDSGDMKYVILKLLQERPMHGYEVMKALEEQTSGCYKPSPGTVYPTLQWLEDEGLVTATDDNGKKVYAITDAGRAFLETNKGTVDDIFERISETIDRVIGEPMGEINRSMGRVAGQAYRAAWKLDANDARRRRIAEILDNAATELASLVQ